MVDRGPAPLVVAVRFGSRGHLADWSPSTPPRGWTYDAAKTASLRWAAENYTALGVRLEPLAYAARAGLTSAVDDAAGVSVSSLRSLHRTHLLDK